MEPAAGVPVCRGRGSGGGGATVQAAPARKRRGRRRAATAAVAAAGAARAAVGRAHQRRVRGRVVHVDAGGGRGRRAGRLRGGVARVRLPAKSRVRDVVLDRALAYARYVRCENIWVDKECIDQDDEAAKDRLVQSMDLVYGQSRRTVALLSRRVETAEDLALLAGLLHGSFVRSGGSARGYELVLAPDRAAAAAAVLRLLDFLTSDPWWTRAWTFQEDYKSSSHMTLLVGHAAALHTAKNGEDGLFGRLRGELCIDSIKFRVEATRFCEAYEAAARASTADAAAAAAVAAVCEGVMDRAARYSVLLQQPPGPHGGRRAISRSMSPRIFKDVGRRLIERESDRLAIAANCCFYPLRLDAAALAGGSLSLAMLALFLLNGELMHNGDGPAAWGALADDVFGFLRRQSLDSFRLSSVAQQLTFIKGCRLGDVELTRDGIRTAGRLWDAGPAGLVVGRPLVPRDLADPPKRRWTATAAMAGADARELRAFADGLRDGLYGGAPCPALALDLERYAAGDDDRHEPEFVTQFRHVMAGEVVDALQKGKQLVLASPVPDAAAAQPTPYRAVFVADDSLLSPDGRDARDAMCFFTAEFPPPRAPAASTSTSPSWWRSEATPPKACRC